MSNRLRYGVHPWKVDSDGDIAIDTSEGKLHITEPELQEMLKQMGVSGYEFTASIIGGGQADDGN